MLNILNSFLLSEQLYFIRATNTEQAFTQDNKTCSKITRKTLAQGVTSYILI